MPLLTCETSLVVNRGEKPWPPRSLQVSFVNDVGIKLKTSNFQILTRQRRLSEPTDVTQMLYSVAVDLLNDFDHPGSFRLIGVVAYDLVGIDDRVQLDLFNTLTRQRRLEVAIDDLATRFGANIVQRANDLTQPPGIRLAPTLDFSDDRAHDPNHAKT